MYRVEAKTTIDRFEWFKSKIQLWLRQTDRHTAHIVESRAALFAAKKGDKRLSNTLND